MADKMIALMAHLMRRAGFGATRDELERYVAKGYEATVEEFLHPEAQPPWDEEIYQRSFPEYGDSPNITNNQVMWAYRMINTTRPLEEKMTLFWHGILCAGYAKVDNGRQQGLQIDMFRRLGLGSFRDLLVELSRDPAMLMFLDNVDNQKGSINENYGRELLELFSMGVGMDGENNYTEDDVKACSRAFTGWNVAPALSLFPFGRSDWEFLYDRGDHDNDQKTFLGETGDWNGEDIVDIIVKHPATGRFISRHLYNFFVADEPPVPAWMDTPPRDMEAIKTLEKAFVENQYEMRPVLRKLFNSDFFKSEAVRYAKVKSPTEVVIGTMRLVGDYKSPKPGLFPISLEMGYMGQELFNPPTVEGWHTGRGWIDTGSLVERINFVSDQVGNITLPGVRDIIDRLAAGSETATPEGFVDGCLDLMGPLDVTDKLRTLLVTHVKQAGPLGLDSEEQHGHFARRVVEMLQMIAASAEYQFG